jgi:opacity protein-like surface antigen
MTNRLIAWVCVLGMMLLAVAQPAAAQDEKGDVSFGYQFVNLSGNSESQSLPTGWFVDLAGNLTRSFAAVAQIGGNYKSFAQSASFGGASASANASLRLYEFMGGIRVSSHASRSVVPFAHVLAGAAYGSGSFEGSGSFAGQSFALSGADSRTDFALQAGGGTNIGVSERVGIRFGVDYLRIFESDGGLNAFRLGAGVNLKF